ncbi:hypothetical protein EYF80_047845 [Liparis tanakae]|uniref:Uncharacterized protein n=1 Tax=Liparis tanakae TaxID=230148 RepID=A0A4Z2FLG3_9TELE|nr:hypothetical protein EYF80_047845 [Liparis tanakae]
MAGVRAADMQLLCFLRSGKSELRTRRGQRSKVNETPQHGASVVMTFDPNEPEMTSKGNVITLRLAPPHLGGYSLLRPSAASGPSSLSRKPVATVPPPRVANSAAVWRPDIRRVNEVAIFTRLVLQVLGGLRRSYDPDYTRTTTDRDQSDF